MGNNNSSQPVPPQNVSPFAAAEQLLKKFPEDSPEYQALNNLKILNDQVDKTIELGN